MASSLLCSICKKRIKSAHIYQCQHITCDSCDLHNKQCAVCTLRSQKDQDSFRKQIHFQWSAQKQLQIQQTPPKQIQHSLSKKKLQYPNTTSTSHGENDHTHYTSLFCQKHDQPVSFYHVSSKSLMCATCLFSGSRYSAYASVRMPQNVIPLRNALDLMKGDLKKSYDELNGYASRIEENIRVCRNSKTIIQTNYDSVMQEIRSICDLMVKCILKKEQEIKEQIGKMLKSKLNYYTEADKQLQKCKEYVKEFRTTASSLRKSQKIDEIAYIFQSEKELRLLLDKLKLDHKSFGLSDLGLLRFNRSVFQEAIQKAFQIRKEQDQRSPIKITQERQVKSKPKKSEESKRRDKSFSYLSVLRMKGLDK